jgi:DNA modification methylase
MKIEIVHVDELKPAEYNPRSLSDDAKKQIMKSIKEFGMVDPIIVNKNKDRKNIIIGGHQRVKVWSEMGQGLIPCVYVDLPLKKERELNVRLNKNVGDWDWDMLEMEFNKEDLIDWGFEEINFTVDHDDETQGGDDVPETPKEPITVMGDLYELGNHRLLCGDSTMIDDVEKLMDGEKADMVFTDPPYGIKVVGGSKSVGGRGFVEANKYESIIGDNSTDTAKQSYLLIKDLESIVFWGGNYMTDFLPPSRGWIVWDKKEKDWNDKFSDFEMAWTNKDIKANMYRQMWMGLIRKGEKGQRVHPTQKPIALAEWCFENYGEPKTVLDLFLGSGSTLIACEKTSRKCYGMELDPIYCDVIVKRYIDYCKNNDRPYSVKRNGEPFEIKS